MVGTQKFLELTFAITLLLWFLAAGWFGLRLSERRALTDTAQPYRAMLADVRKDYCVEYLLVSGKSVIGETKLTITSAVTGSFEIMNDFRARLKLLGTEEDYYIKSYMSVNARYELDILRVSLNVLGQDFLLTGERQIRKDDKKMFMLSFRAGETVLQKFAVPSPEGYMMADTLMPLFKMAKPRPGHTWTTKLVDPLSKKIREFKFSVLDLEELPGGNENLLGYPIRMEYENYIYMAYADENGEIMWEEVPFGVILIRKDIAPLLGFLPSAETGGVVQPTTPPIPDERRSPD